MKQNETRVKHPYTDEHMTKPLLHIVTHRKVHPITSRRENVRIYYHKSLPLVVVCPCFVPNNSDPSTVIEQSVEAEVGPRSLRNEGI